MDTNLSIDFDTMRVNCIQIHQETHELALVFKKYNIEEEVHQVFPDFIFKDELAKHPDTKSWDGMGRYAKKLLDQQAMWDLLPASISVRDDRDNIIWWEKAKAQQSLKDCFQELGGQKLFNV